MASQGGSHEGSPRDPNEPAAWFRSYSASSVGIEIVVSVVLGLGAGLWLEKEVTHWGPWTTLVGLLVGLGAAAKAIQRTIAEQRRAEERRSSEPQGATPAKGAVAAAEASATLAGRGHGDADRP
jgi:F0F1-type ATP synthase assembly protein I